MKTKKEVKTNILHRTACVLWFLFSCLVLLGFPLIWVADWIVNPQIKAGQRTREIWRAWKELAL